MRLSHQRYVKHVRTDGERIAVVAERGLDAPVPSCPGWTVSDAVEHTAEVFLHKVACMRDKVFPDPWPPERGDAPTVPYLRKALGELLHELTSRDELEFADTWWWDERTVGFWGRRMAHEAAIHRVDVELAHDDVTDLPVDATASGEQLSMYLWLWGRGPRDPLVIDGDVSVADHLRDRMVVATQ